MAAKALSATMAVAIADTLERGGKLVRYQGGYWSVPGIMWNGSAPVWYIGTSTVEALRTRGYLTYTEYQQGRRGDFPIAAEVHAEPKVAA
jgi:hypothetical protein